MRVHLNYGRGQRAVDLPDTLDVAVIAKQAMPQLADPAAATDQALAEPVGCAPLAVEAARAESACILICDFTRPVPNGVILPPLIRTLLGAGMAPERITVLVATGLHRPNEGEELAALVGDPWVLETVEVANHFAREGRGPRAGGHDGARHGGTARPALHRG